MKNKMTPVMGGILLVVGLVLAACENPLVEEADKWTNVTSLNQMDGTWKGSFHQSLNLAEESMEGSGAEWSDEMEEMLGDITVSISAEAIITINAAKKTITGSLKMVQEYSGKNIDTIWPEISDSLNEVEDVEVEVDDSKHTITLNLDIPEESIDIDDMDNVQINQNGTKLKISDGRVGEDIPEMILTKQ